MAAGWPTKANYATGDVLSATNMNDLSGTVNYIDPTSATDGQVLTRDAASSGKVKWATPSAGSTNVAGKNSFLNSNFSIWQRGTSIACSSTAYGADRWQAYRTVAGATMSRQVTNDTTNLPFIQYCARVQRDSGNTATTAIFIGQSLETVNSIPLVGKSVTFSFYARAGANYSAASSALSVVVSSGTGTDQNVLTSYTSANNFISQTATLTTTWQRFSYTGTVPTTATEVGTYIYYTPVGTAGANDYFEITGVQLEIASSVSAYSTNAPTQALEISACQRYFERYAAPSGSVFYTGFQQTSTSPRISASVYPKRTTPTITLTGAGTGQVMVTGGTTYNITSIDAISYAETANIIGFRANIASGGTAGDACALYSSAGIVNIDYSSEL